MVDEIVSRSKIVHLEDMASVARKVMTLGAHEAQVDPCCRMVGSSPKSGGSPWSRVSHPFRFQ